MNDQHPHIDEIIISGIKREGNRVAIAQVNFYDDETTVSTLKVFEDGERKAIPAINIDLRTDDERADLDE